MLPIITLNLCYTVIGFVLMGFCNDMQRYIYPTLPIVMESVINSTLLRYNIEPCEMSISLFNSLMNGTSSVGMALSTIFILPLADTKGRKFVCVYLCSIGGFLISVFHLICAFFESAESFLMSELLLGASMAVRSFTFIIFVSESSPDKYRGSSTFALMVGNPLASMFMFSIASPQFLGKMDTWFIFPTITLVLSIVCFCILIKVHESPKWLVRQNKMKEAELAVEFYHGKSNEDVIDSMVREKNITESSKLSLTQIVNDETLRESLFIVSLVNVLVWLCPNTIESTYVQQLHADVGFTVEQTLNISLFFSIIFIPGQFLGTLLIDKIGRRKMVFILGFSMIVKTCISITTLTISNVIGTSIFTKVAMIFSDTLTNFERCMGLNSLATLLISELFPISARTAVGQLASFFGVFAMLPLSTLFPIFYSIFTPAFYVPFLFIQPVILYFLFEKLPETKQRAVCDIIESMCITVASRRTTIISEKTPLIRKRAITLLASSRDDSHKERKRSKTMIYNNV